MMNYVLTLMLICRIDIDAGEKEMENAFIINVLILRMTNGSQKENQNVHIYIYIFFLFLLCTLHMVCILVCV